MRSSVDAAAFYKAMTALLDIPTKSSIRALREIKVAFDANQCVLSATDLNTWMSVTLPASGDSFDFVFRNSASIQKICRHFDGELELELQQRGDESQDCRKMPVPGCFLASFFHNGFNWFWLVIGLVSKYRVHGLGRFLAGCVFFCRSKLNLRVLWTIPFANIEIMQ